MTKRLIRRLRSARFYWLVIGLVALVGAIFKAPLYFWLVIMGAMISLLFGPTARLIFWALDRIDELKERRRK